MFESSQIWKNTPKNQYLIKHAFCNVGYIQCQCPKYYGYECFASSWVEEHACNF
jgi:hypothetical protein